MNRVISGIDVYLRQKWTLDVNSADLRSLEKCLPYFSMSTSAISVITGHWSVIVEKDLPLHQQSKIAQDVGKYMKTAQRWYITEYDKQIRSVLRKIDIRKYVYLSCPPMTTSAAKVLANKSYNKALSRRTWPIKVIEVAAETVTIAENEIWSTVLINRAKLTSSV